MQGPASPRVMSLIRHDYSIDKEGNYSVAYQATVGIEPRTLHLHGRYDQMASSSPHEMTRGYDSSVFILSIYYRI